MTSSTKSGVMFNNSVELAFNCADIDKKVYVIHVLLNKIETQRKGPKAGKLKIEFCITSPRGHSACHIDTKMKCLAQFLTALLRIHSFKTWNMKR